ncbi:MAG: bifunctional phosphopantothenoylcysteine decarboxylase/phosphopantothenate--cysteine ligase CoaBC [Chloroflexi bacterium]|nr:bifunctional phosphopantothenoylcysteine decarboxylase/phosphopantothenate--cysteine ligase CoaBC [Chloroflexota bacterium]
MTVLREKNILLGVTGGISAYKVCTLASHLTQAGAIVNVVMTEAATRFVAPLTYQALTGHPVYTDLFTTPGEGLPTHIAHVGLAHLADLLVIAPASANTLAKMASGVADNLLTTLALAARCPILAVPAMDVGMWSHPATQANAAILRERGVHFAGPARGRMASGLEGEGRMVEPDVILGHIRRVMGSAGALAGRRVVVTAGPTREMLDPVRFISNPSSGRQGFALAQAALDQGADVTLISGPTVLSTPVGAERVDVISAQEMCDTVLATTADADVLLMTAAVGDYYPAERATQKIKKSEAGLAINLIRTPDIVGAVASRRLTSGFPRVIVGFAAESERVVENARDKLLRKNLDLIVANDVTAPGAGFAAETNQVTIVDRRDGVTDLPLMSKAEVSEVIIQHVVALLPELDSSTGI